MIENDEFINSTFLGLVHSYLSILRRNGRRRNDSKLLFLLQKKREQVSCNLSDHLPNNSHSGRVIPYTRFREAREVLFNYLKSLPEDTLMILSSHRIDEIADLVNRLIEMDLGKIVVDKALIPVNN